MIEMELVIIVVLDDGETELLGQHHEVEPALRTQHDRCRKLMMRRHIDRPHALAPAQGLELVQPHALMVELDGRDLCAGRAERLARRRIAQRFHDGDVARLDQNARGDVNAHLAAAHDADVVRAAA